MVMIVNTGYRIVLDGDDSQYWILDSDDSQPWIIYSVGDGSQDMDTG